jgi:hypothetical protein
MTWLLSHTWRELIGAAVVLGLFAFILCWNAHERSIGDAACEQRVAAARTAQQKIADDRAAPENAALHGRYDPIGQAIDDLETRYHAAHPDDGCGPVKYVRKVQP